MKKILALRLCLSLVFCLFACTDSKTPQEEEETIKITDLDEDGIPEKNGVEGVELPDLTVKPNDDKKEEATDKKEETTDKKEDASSENPDSAVSSDGTVTQTKPSDGNTEQGSAGTADGNSASSEGSAGKDEGNTGSSQGDKGQNDTGKGETVPSDPGSDIGIELPEIDF